MAKMKKGVMINLGIFLVGLAVLSLLSLTFSAGYSSSDIAGITAVYDRSGLAACSIGNGLRNIILSFSGIDASFSEGRMNFIERFPNTHDTQFKSEVDSWKSFVEAEDSHITLNVQELKDHLPMVIMPQNITYYHPEYGKKSLEIIPEELNFEGYIIDLQAAKNITKCDYTTTPGNFSVEFSARVGSSTECSQTFLIDPYSTNTINVNIKGEGITELEISNGGKLVLVKTSSIDLNITVLANATHVELPPETLVMSFPTFGFYAKSPVTIFK